MELWKLVWFLTGLIACWGGFAIYTVSANAWAMDNCHTGNIDLVFVADASVVSTYDGKQNIRHKDKQMQFFSSVVDIFTPSGDGALNNRVRVYLLVATEDNVTGVSAIQERTNISWHAEKEHLKWALKKESVEFKENSKPMEAIPYLKEMSSNETYWIRDNSTLVIVMFGSHQNVDLSYSINDLNNDLNISDHNVTVKLFMLVLKDSPPDRLKLTSNVAIYKIADIHDDLAKNVAVLMCDSCFCGWFGGNSDSSAFSKTLGTSCYRLWSRSSPISWLEASELCKRDNSQLVSIETKEELTSLRHQLNQQIKELPKVGNITDNITMYIGLRRLKSTIGKRFRWLNDHPLVYTHWGHSEPRGGSINGCVMWDLFNLFGSLNVDEDQMNYTDKLLTAATNGAWSAIGCGHAVTRYYLCETGVTFPLSPPSHHEKKFHLNVPEYERITKAIGRGELGFMQNLNMFMSLSALLKLWKSELLVNGYAYENHKMDAIVALNEIRLYHCDGNDGMIPYTSVCDVSKDCPFALDETVCRKCNSQEKECAASRQCIPANAWCDLVQDCRDNSDETNCDACRHGLCNDGMCMLKSWFADGEIDCSGCDSSNISYEMDYVQRNNITDCLFTCNRTDCVYRWMLGDSVVHCRGPEGPIDETIGKFEAVSCHTVSDNSPYQFSNWGPKCIYIKDIYGELFGCRNMRHLQGCENFTCPDGYYQCPQSYCIPTHYIRNEIMDCPHGEDEDYDMQFLQCPFYFMCQGPSYRRNSFLCLHPDLVCDGRVDCPGGEDELNCFMSCLEGFRCIAGTMIVEDYKKAKTAQVIRLLDSKIRYLDLSGINLSKEFPIFFRNSTVNLIEVKMTNCNIVTTSFPVPACSLGTIRRLDLSYNDIINISANSVFRCMTNLYDLNLSHNEKLTSLQGIEFEINTVKYMDLSYTGLTYLSPRTFSFLRDVKYLSLRRTRITDVRFLPRTTVEILDLRDTSVNNLPYSNMFKHVVILVNLRTDSFKLCCPQLHNTSTNISSCSFTKDPFSSCTDLMSNLVLRIILWTDGFLAVVGNLIVIIYRLFFDRSIFSVAYGHFVTHLSISDFIMGVYLSIIAIADIYFRDEYIWQETAWRKSVMCNIAGFLSTVSIEVSTMFIALITIDRFLVIRYPFGQMRIAGRAVIVCCSIVWFIGVCVALIPLLPIRGRLNIYNTNGMCLGLPLENYKDSGRDFAFTVFIVLNCSMFILITCGQVIIYRTVSAMRMNESSLTNSNSRRSQDLAVAKNLAVVAITNFLFWSPIGVMGIMVQCGYTIGIEAYAWTAVLILPINAAVNPLLYTVPAITRKLNKVKERSSS